MNKPELIAAIAEDAGMTQRSVEKMLDAMARQVTAATCGQGEAVLLAFSMAHKEIAMLKLALQRPKTRMTPAQFAALAALLRLRGGLDLRPHREGAGARACAAGPGCRGWRN